MQIRAGGNGLPLSLRAEVAFNYSHVELAKISHQRNTGPFFPPWFCTRHAHSPSSHHRRRHRIPFCLAHVCALNQSHSRLRLDQLRLLPWLCHAGPQPCLDKRWICVKRCGGGSSNSLLKPTTSHPRSGPRSQGAQSDPLIPASNICLLLLLFFYYTCCAGSSAI